MSLVVHCIYHTHHPNCSCFRMLLQHTPNVTVNLLRYCSLLISTSARCTFSTASLLQRSFTHGCNGIIVAVVSSTARSHCGRPRKVRTEKTTTKHASKNGQAFVEDRRKGREEERERERRKEKRKKGEEKGRRRKEEKEREDERERERKREKERE